jgi:hypothetical protein
MAGSSPILSATRLTGMPASSSAVSDTVKSNHLSPPGKLLLKLRGLRGLVKSDNSTAQNINAPFGNFTSDKSTGMPSGTPAKTRKSVRVRSIVSCFTFRCS